jgi:hypothetical protein
VAGDPAGVRDERGRAAPVDPLPPALQARLRAVLRSLASVCTPVDAGAALPAEAFATALGCLLDSPDMGAVVTVTASTVVSDPVAEIPGAAAAPRCAARGAR